MPEWVTNVLAPLVNLVAVPIVAYLFTRSEKKAQKREDANREFNAHMLWGMKAIGGLAKANTVALKNLKVDEETEDALSEYNRFHKELSAFTSQQTAKTL